MSAIKKLITGAAGAAGGEAEILNVEDVFSTTVYNGTGSHNVVDSGINLGQSNDGGSIYLELQAEGVEIAQSSDFNFGTGDFTCEAWIWLNDSNATYRTMLGFDVSGGILFQVYQMKLDFGVRGTSSTQSTATLNDNQWNHVAIVRSSGTSYLFINGSLDSTSTNHNGTNFSNGSAALIGDYSKGATNFNGRISNLRVSTTARYTSSFTVSTTPLEADANTVLLIGQNDDPFSDNSSSGHSAVPYGGALKSKFGPFTASDAGKGGLAWVKVRTQSNSHVMLDTERGDVYEIWPNQGSANVAASEKNYSFDANGLSMNTSDGQVNNGSHDYVSWMWRKAPKFFDVQTFSTTGSSSVPITVNHDLGSVPGFYIVKRTDASGDLACFHRSQGSSKYGALNNSDAFQNGSTSKWYQAPDSNSIYLGSDFVQNASYVAWFFAHNDNDGGFGINEDQDIVKCGSFTTDGSGLFDVDLGFEPQWVMVKAVNSQLNWEMYDVSRGWHVNGHQFLVSNGGNAEGTNLTAQGIFPHSTGFASNQNYWGTNETLIYIAIRRGPMASPTDANDVFYLKDGTIPSSLQKTGWPIDTLIMAEKDRSPWGGNVTYDRLRGENHEYYTNFNLDEGSVGDVEFDHSTGFVNARGNDLGGDAIQWLWKRAPNYYDHVHYIGNGSSSQTIYHNLTSAPQMVWIKNRDSSSDWGVYFNDGSLECTALLNSDAAVATLGISFTSSANFIRVFSSGFQITPNTSGANYFAYLFGTVDGVSKVGSFSHTFQGGDTNVDCGFTNGARWVLVKRSSGTGEWKVYDVERGIIAGNDNELTFSSTDAQVTSNDGIDPYSAGFTMPSSGVNTGTYIFYAIA